VEINLVSAIPLVTQVIFAMPMNYIVDNYGIKVSLITNGTFLIIGI